MIIAIDGPAGSGKGTLARKLANALGYAHLDTGKLYRTVGMSVVEAGENPANEEAALRAARSLEPQMVVNKDLLGDIAAASASKVAAIRSVRAILLAFQREFANAPPNRAKGAVLDGRDIGTVVCPDADIKLFVTASTEVRAKRRHKELLDRGEPSIYSRVLQDMKVRDKRDEGRAVAPLKPAHDALVIDTSELDADAVFETAMNIVSEDA
ncbi:MAG: cytidylate kinase [Rhodospirillaceae bacterium]|nr:cytidylate kinase [Rhodospirillaceae bacterium]